ncbi:hypothetical protein AAFF_G00055600 [Aldrovandia affinis]|uniref:Uncharacterized protein n=1 Tax=Aldrovandia affinis TaxID=143900 RepID=A0AAD7S325_9TELE|nr:hypothetical protein AAFF_G00055600 [Aldrovandia affinis]
MHTWRSFVFVASTLLSRIELVKQRFQTRISQCTRPSGDGKSGWHLPPAQLREWWGKSQWGPSGKAGCCRTTESKAGIDQNLISGQIRKAVQRSSRSQDQQAEDANRITVPGRKGKPAVEQAVLHAVGDPGDKRE